MSNRQWGSVNGPRTPATATPPLAPGSFRRTSTVDALREQPSGGITVTGRGRDLWADGPAPRAVPLGASLVGGFDAELDSRGALARLSTDGLPLDATSLVGQSTLTGWGRTVDRMVAGGSTTLVGALLDDLATVSRLRTYADIYIGTGTGFDPQLAPADICSGWREGGTLLTSVRQLGDIPLPQGPPAPDLTSAGDEASWHVAPPLRPRAFRRRRRVDVVAGRDAFVEALVRDSFGAPDGNERVVHEYGLTLTVDIADRTVRDVEVAAHVLPWRECPAAVASAGRAVGQPIDELARFVASELRGTSTCTHLNALFRAVAAATRHALQAIDTPNTII